MTQINKIVLEFRDLIASSWATLETIKSSDETGSFIIDWLQVNWELAVEGKLDKPSIILEIYGEGADCNGSSSRVLYPDRIPTHRVVCVSKTEGLVFDHLYKKQLEHVEHEIVFDRFVSLNTQNWYVELPPFDMALCHHLGNEVVVDIASIDFVVTPIEPRKLKTTASNFGGLS